MNGTQLKEILQKHNLTGRDLSAKLKQHERGVYGYFLKKEVNSKIIEKIIKVTGIERMEFYPNEENQLIHDAAHHGERVKQLIVEKEISVTSFARKMKVARQTVHNWFDEKEWSNGRLLEAAEVLGISVEAIKRSEGNEDENNIKILNLLNSIYTILQEQTELLRLLINKSNLIICVTLLGMQ